jgi:hypothetical protein
MYGFICFSNLKTSYVRCFYGYDGLPSIFILFLLLSYSILVYSLSILISHYLI